MSNIRNSGSAAWMRLCAAHRTCFLPDLLPGLCVRAYASDYASRGKAFSNHALAVFRRKSGIAAQAVSCSTTHNNELYWTPHQYSG